MYGPSFKLVTNIYLQRYFQSRVDVIITSVGEFQHSLSSCGGYHPDSFLRRWTN